MKKTFALLSVIWILMLAFAIVLAGHNDNIPYRFSGTYASDAVTLTFSGHDDVTAICGDVTVTGTYMNGTTGTKLVVWMDFGENCPEELKFLESTREEYLEYVIGENDAGEYMEIDGMKYYKQG